MAGYDHFRAGRPDDARREWTACLELDSTHDFCEFGISVLDAGTPRQGDASAAEPPVMEAPPAKAPETPLIGRTPGSLKAAPEKKDEHEALQAYYTGLIYYQKGDMAKARAEWSLALGLAPKGSAVESDAKAALEKLDKDEASTRGEGKK